MLKVVFFELKRFSVLKGKWNDPQQFTDYTVITNFISNIGEENVVSTSYYSSWKDTVSCAITYRDDELLTCPACSKEISNGFKFCPECGVKLK